MEDWTKLVSSGWLPSKDFWTSYHLMDALEVFFLAVTVLLIRQALVVAIQNQKHLQESFVTSLQDSRYDAVDFLYFELLRERIKRPGLSEPDRLLAKHGTDSDAWREYSAYAFLMWNFVETICDKCADDADLLATWGPIIVTESNAHATWFLEMGPTPGSYKNTESFKACFFTLGKDLIETRRSKGSVSHEDLVALLADFRECLKASKDKAVVKRK